MVGTGVVLGMTLAVRRRSRAGDAPEDNLASYLIDHLTGSDAALTVVTRLSHSHERTEAGQLFADLAREFSAERDEVRAVLRQLGRSPVSAKSAISYASGALLQAAAGGKAGTLALFRTLEALLIGVQGKRCLWRALQTLELSFEDAARFSALETQALDQWRRIEAARQAQLPLTFGMTD